MLSRSLLWTPGTAPGPEATTTRSGIGPRACGGALAPRRAPLPATCGRRATRAIIWAGAVSGTSALGASASPAHGPATLLGARCLLWVPSISITWGSRSSGRASPAWWGTRPRASTCWSAPAGPPVVIAPRMAVVIAPSPRPAGVGDRHPFDRAAGTPQLDEGCVLRRLRLGSGRGNDGDALELELRLSPQHVSDGGTPRQEAGVDQSPRLLGSGNPPRPHTVVAAAGQLYVDLARHAGRQR